MLFDAAVSAEIDGLRRGLGEADLGHIPPHLTIIPPVNVRDVDAAQEVLRAAGRASRPLDLELGPMATFLPNSPVAYLAIGGDVDGLVRLRDAAFQPPLARELSWPYVPHVTVVDGAPDARIDAACQHLDAFHLATTVRAIHLLEEVDHRWLPMAAFPLGPPIVIGTGAAAVELELLRGEGDVTIRARADGAQVGEARAWCRGPTAWLSSIEVAEGRRRDGIGTHLLAAVQSWAAEQDADAIEVDPSAVPVAGVGDFLSARGWRADPPRLRRDL